MKKVENPIQNQPSDLWIRNSLNCENSYEAPNGYITYRFKAYLVRFIQSIDPNFDENDIIEALYMTSEHADYDDIVNVNFCAGFIYAKTPKAAFNIENLLHKQKVADLFPGYQMPRMPFSD